MPGTSAPLPEVTADLRTPVIVGAGQLRANRGRTVEQAREPLELLLEAARSTGSPALLRKADAVFAVHVASWAYDNLAARVGSALGATPATLVNTGLGGHLPVRLLDQAAALIWSGDSEIALVVGGEAQASVSLLFKAGVDPSSLGWSAAPGGPPAFDADQLGSRAMQAAGLMYPTRVYPLFENRLQADLGLTPQQAQDWSAQLYADLSEVASGNPAAWNRDCLTPEQVGRASSTNRMVCEPYPLLMNAMPHVDQAAALLVTSLGTALAHGLPPESIIYVWGGAGADDDPDVLLRRGFGDSAALGSALDRCLSQAGTSVADLDLIDVYSCFPVVPKLVGRHLGLPRDRVLSVTGGHSSFGGPLNSYSLHALVAMTGLLRRGGQGMVHANGGYLTYQHAVLLSSRPHPEGYVGHPSPVVVAPVGAPPLVELDGPTEVVVETATVEHDRDGQPRQAFLVATTSAGQRVAVSTGRQARLLSLKALPDGLTTHVGRRLRVTPAEEGAQLEPL